MIKIHVKPEAVMPPMLESCRVRRVDPQNAVCMVHKADCVWATPFGNYCEHPLVQYIREYEPQAGLGGPGSLLH